jgi:hypothetical protein
MDVIRIMTDYDAMGINRIFLAAAHTWASASQISKLAQLVQVARAHNIEVHGMTMEDPYAVYPKDGNYDDVINSYISPVISSNLFDGLHIDCEPHGIREDDNHPKSNYSEYSFPWSNDTDPDDDVDDTDYDNNNTIMGYYCNLLSAIRDEIDENRPGFEFSAAIGYWYHDKYQNELGEFFSIGQYAEYVDTLVPMCYGDPPSDVGASANSIKDELDEEGHALNSDSAEEVGLP